MSCECKAFPGALGRQTRLGATQAALAEIVGTQPSWANWIQWILSYYIVYYIVLYIRIYTYQDVYYICTRFELVTVIHEIYIRFECQTMEKHRMCGDIYTLTTPCITRMLR